MNVNFMIFLVLKRKNMFSFKKNPTYLKKKHMYNEISTFQKNFKISYNLADIDLNWISSFM